MAPVLAAAAFFTASISAIVVGACGRRPPPGERREGGVYYPAWETHLHAPVLAHNLQTRDPLHFLLALAYALAEHVLARLVQQ